MIDVFVKVNTPMKDVPAMLDGMDASCVMVRNGGPTEVWEKQGGEWQSREPGMTRYDALASDIVELVAYDVTFGGGFSELVGDGMGLRLSKDEADAFITDMKKYHYRVEDAIGCSVNVDGRSCALACFPLGEFKTMVDLKAPWGSPVADWINHVKKAGADEVGIVISHKNAQ